MAWHYYHSDTVSSHFLCQNSLVLEITWTLRSFQPFSPQAQIQVPLRTALSHGTVRDNPNPTLTRGNYNKKKIHWVSAIAKSCLVLHILTDANFKLAPLVEQGNFLGLSYNFSLSSEVLLLQPLHALVPSWSPMWSSYPASITGPQRKHIALFHYHMECQWRSDLQCRHPNPFLGAQLLLFWAEVAALVKMSSSQSFKVKGYFYK